MRLRFLSWLLLLAWLAIPATAQDPTVESVARAHVATVAQAEQAVVGITASARRRGAGYYGTGTIISGDGYILTSITVVPSDCDQIQVILSGGREVAAALVGTVDELELSLIKIDETGLAAMALGSSSTLALGETIYTLGNCLQSIETDGQVSLSIGIISGFYELDEAQDESDYTGACIETTAALNPGVDGGPLVDSQGELVGLLSLNYAQNRWLSVAIPIDLLKPHLLELMGAEEDDSPVLAPPRGTNRAALARAATGVVAIEVVRTPEEEPSNPRRAAAAEALRKLREAPVSGFLISEDGWILTSYYNISGDFQTITVHLPGGKQASAELFGWDQSKDIALLKVEAEGLPVPTWAEDHAYGTGDFVYVLGKSPDRARLNLTEGIISATGRFWGHCVQLDAKLNYGNTGGPVVNRQGEVVGIACHIAEGSEWGQSSGIGFCTPWPKIREVLGAMREGERIDVPPQPFLGVQFDTRAVDVQGARIQQVIAGTAAEEAGIEAGDTIIELNGVEILNPTDLAREIRKFQPGVEVTMKVERQGSTVDLKATLRARPEGE